MATSPDRIPCLRAPKGCRRTAAREKYDEDVEIICGKCWRAFVPTRIRRRDRMLHRELRRLERRMNPDLLRIHRVRGLLHRNWAAMHRALIAQPKPAGLEPFLKEVGLS